MYTWTWNETVYVDLGMRLCMWAWEQCYVDMDLGTRRCTWTWERGYAHGPGNEAMHMDLGMRLWSGNEAVRTDMRRCI